MMDADAMTQFSKVLLRHSLRQLEKAVKAREKSMVASLKLSQYKWGTPMYSKLRNKSEHLRKLAGDILSEVCSLVMQTEGMFKRYKSKVILDAICVSKFKELAKKAIIATNLRTSVEYLFTPSYKAMYWLGFVDEKRGTGKLRDDGKPEFRYGWWFGDGIDFSVRLGLTRFLTKKEIHDMRNKYLGKGKWKNRKNN